MSVASAARPRQSAPRGHLVPELPLRYPDSSSRTVMTRRGWWLVLLNFVVPGSAQAAAGNRRLGRIGLAATLVMWVLVVLAGITFLLARSFFLSVATFWPALLLLEVLIVLYAVLWIVLAFDTLRLVRLVKAAPLARIGIAALAVLLLVGTTAGAAKAVQVVDATRSTVMTVFGASAASVPPSDGYYNILLLGADSGEGRDSMRFDSISVVSVNADTGAVTIFGIPRDMAHVPFRDGSPMQALYPKGFQGHSSSTCGWSSGINQLTNAVQTCRDDHGESLYPDADAQGSSPEVEATKDAAEGVLGIDIPYYAFIDMDGFAALVDALGGVDINVTERLPEGGGPHYEGQPADKWATGWIEVGQQHMDGDTAQWYARSRYTTSDWDRMLRQRQLQEAILAQFTPANVLARFNEVAAAGQHLVHTDVPGSMLGYFTDLAIKAKEHPVATIELTPEGAGVNPDKADWNYIHQLVQNALHPVTATPTP